jgi:hypothetical protein
MLGIGGGRSATLPSRSVQRDWMASILSGGATWTLAMAAVSIVVASLILLVAAISRPGMALEMECVGYPFTARVGHEDSNATVGICSMQ